MQLYRMNWMAVERYLATDDRVVVPIGSTEQHGYLSLGTDAILAELVAERAAEPLGIPVLPVLPFGFVPYFTTFPGTISLRFETYARVIVDILDTLADQGFRRIAIINGHGGNEMVTGRIREWRSSRTDAPFVLFHSWYSGSSVAEFGAQIDERQRHGSWFERFEATIVDDQVPAEDAPMVDGRALPFASAEEIRRMAPTGSLGGPHVIDDPRVEEMLTIGAQEVRALLEHGWIEE
ncbi:MAG: creatininase family protein [Acidimicrobiales bacterium]